MEYVTLSLEWELRLPFFCIRIASPPSLFPLSVFRSKLILQSCISSSHTELLLLSYTVINPTSRSLHCCFLSVLTGSPYCPDPGVGDHSHETQALTLPFTSRCFSETQFLNALKIEIIKVVLTTIRILWAFYVVEVLCKLLKSIQCEFLFLKLFYVYMVCFSD